MRISDWSSDVCSSDLLDVLGHRLGEEVEGDGVVAHHGLGHGGDRRIERGDDEIARDLDLVVIGGEALGHDVAVAELVALDAAHRLEADREGRQVLLRSEAHTSELQSLMRTHYPAVC